MAKVVNITEKLSFDENPRLVVQDQEFEVNADAETVIKVMGVLAEENQLQAMNKAMRLMFKPEDIEKICAIQHKGQKLTAKGLMTIIEEAMSLVMGEDAGE